MSSAGSESPADKLREQSNEFYRNTLQTLRKLWPSNPSQVVLYLNIITELPSVTESGAVVMQLIKTMPGFHQDAALMLLCPLDDARNHALSELFPPTPASSVLCRGGKFVIHQVQTIEDQLKNMAKAVQQPPHQNGGNGISFAEKAAAILQKPSAIIIAKRVSHVAPKKAYEYMKEFPTMRSNAINTMNLSRTRATLEACEYNWLQREAGNVEADEEVAQANYAPAPAAPAESTSPVKPKFRTKVGDVVMGGRSSSGKSVKSVTPSAELVMVTEEKVNQDPDSVMTPVTRVWSEEPIPDEVPVQRDEWKEMSSGGKPN